MACHIEANSFGGTVTLNNRKNGSNGSMAISVSAYATGGFEDSNTADYTSTNVGDLLDYGVVATSIVGTLTMDWIGAHFFASEPAECMMGSIPPLGISNSVASGAILYSSLFGGGIILDDVTRATGKVPYAATASTYVNHLIQAGFNAAATFTVLINNGASALSLSSISGTTGYFIDNSHSVAVSAGDTCANRVVGSGQSGTSVTWDGAGLLLTAS